MYVCMYVCLYACMYACMSEITPEPQLAPRKSYLYTLGPDVGTAYILAALKNPKSQTQPHGTCKLTLSGDPLCSAKPKQFKQVLKPRRILLMIQLLHHPRYAILSSFLWFWCISVKTRTASIINNSSWILHASRQMQDVQLLDMWFNLRHEFGSILRLTHWGPDPLKDFSTGHSMIPA